MFNILQLAKLSIKVYKSFNLLMIYLFNYEFMTNNNLSPYFLTDYKNLWTRVSFRRHSLKSCRDKVQEEFLPTWLKYFASFGVLAAVWQSKKITFNVKYFYLETMFSLTVTFSSNFEPICVFHISESSFKFGTLPDRNVSAP